MKIEMVLKTDKGNKKYTLKDIDFTNVMCDLEDKGVDVMGLLDKETRKNMKVFTVMRALVAVLTGTEDQKAAGSLLSEHLRNDGDMDTIFNAFTEVMQGAGFGNAEETDIEASPSAEK